MSIRNYLIDRLGRRQNDYEWRTWTSLLPVEALRTVLILHTDQKLGDGMLNSIFVTLLGEEFPEFEIVMGTTADFVEYWSSHPAVSRVVLLPERGTGNLLARLVRIRKAGRALRGKFDLAVVYDPFAYFDTFQFLHYLQARHVAGFDKHVYPLFDYSLDDAQFGQHKRHISERTRNLLRLFGVEREPTADKMHAPVTETARKEVSRWLDLAPAGETKILFNTYGALPERQLTIENIERILRGLADDHSEKTVFVSISPDMSAADRVRIASLQYGRIRIVPVPRLRGYFSVFALVEAMDAVITPDTAVAHAAAAFGKPTVCLYRDPYYTPLVYSPLNENCAKLLPRGRSVNEVDWREADEAIRGLVASLERGQIHPVPFSLG